MRDLRVSILQTDLVWEAAEINRMNFEREMEGLPSTDLIILPEMFTTGFTMNAKPNAEEFQGPTYRWMQTMAEKYQCAITGSIIVKENDQFYNRLLFVTPDGKVEKYDKRHTFTLAGENKTYASGNEKVVVSYKGWKICPLICYDLRFPVWIRNVENYDLLLFVANWPERRIAAWDVLLRARAIENMAYCIGVNRIGEDGNGHPYVGHSAAYDVLGNKMSKSPWESSFTETVTLSKEYLEDLRKQLQFLEDKDAFNLL